MDEVVWWSLAFAAAMTVVAFPLAALARVVTRRWTTPVARSGPVDLAALEATALEPIEIAVLEGEVRALREQRTPH